MKADGTTADLAHPEEKDIKQILELNRLIYGPQDILANAADFHWRYGENPAGEAIIPVIRNEQGEIVGFIWVIPTRLRVSRGETSRSRERLKKRCHSAVK